jgi:2-polyprenyl-3-methyl-5-hydroxy-6-metoxy-1,4-benzoquinol methylase
MDILDIWNKSATEYSKMSGSKILDSYEYEINSPAILSMVDKEYELMLDIGCGTGELCENLHNLCSEIYLCDGSAEMIEIAKGKYPNYKYFKWDISKKYEFNKKFDLILCKLVLMFIEDLDNAAKNIAEAMNSNGELIISVIHPIYWYTGWLKSEYKIDGRNDFNQMTKGYFSSKAIVYRNLLGNETDPIPFIHHTVSDYISAFINYGFQLVQIQEPKMNQKFVNDNKKFTDRINIPMRLNMKFKLVNYNNKIV